MRTMTTPSTARRRGTLQRSFVPLREIANTVMTLDAPASPEKETACSVLEVQGVNYLLKSEAEQHLLNDIFRVVLASLSFPLHVLVRIQPVTLETGLATYRPNEEGDPQWNVHARAYTSFVEELAAQRTLMQRRFYIIVPAGQTVAEENGDGTALPLHGLFRGIRRRRTEVAEARAQTLERLEQRCRELRRQLVAMGLAVRRLDDHELLELEYSMLSGARAQRTPLLATWVEGVARPVITHTVPPTPLPVVFSSVPRPPEEKTNDSTHDTIGHTQPTTRATTRRSSARRRQAGATQAAYPPWRWPHLADVLAPSGILVTPSMLCVDAEWVQVLDVVALPRQVRPGWLNRLATLDVPVDLCFTYTPLPPAQTMRRLQRKRFETATTNELNRGKGKLAPSHHLAQSDIEGLMTRLAAGQDRLLEFSLRLLVRGESTHAVEQRAAQLRSILQSMLISARPCLFEQDKAFRSCLPHARNELRMVQAPLTMASHEASSTFPFLSHTLVQTQGVLEGITLEGHEPVLRDWWALDLRNANRLLVAPSGAGKSFKAKLDVLRSQLWYGQRQRSAAGPLRYQTLIVDLEREYQQVTGALAGQWVRIAPGTSHCLNPFDLPRPHPGQTGGEDVLAEKVAHLQALLEILLAEGADPSHRRLSQTEKGVLDRVLFACYARKGITRDPATQRREPPVLHDLYAVLCEQTQQEAASLAQRLHRFVDGSLAGLFTGQTTVTLDTHPVVCFDIRDLSADLRPIALFLIASSVWNLSITTPLPRQFVVDELLTLYQYAEGKHFLESLFQRARKHYLSVVGITQYPKILLDSTIPSNCATTMVLAQELVSLPLVREIFQLSEPEVQAVRSFAKGEALLLSGDTRVTVRFEASEHEYALCTSDPADLADTEEHQSAE